MDYAEYLRWVPKVELHCHVEGTLRPATVVELARKHDIALPTTDVERIYAYEINYEFLEIFRLVHSTVVDRDDFARVACPTSTAVVYGWPDLTTHPITRMITAGLNVMLNSDDPTIFHTDIGREYVDFCGQDGYGREVVRQLLRNGVEATWLDAAGKSVLWADFEAEPTALDAELEAGGGAGK